ncbi:MAG: 50S ribosomal protein L25 [Patescibacteria group bacterium]|jgi:large subunit ribosomal protein L25
MTEFKLEAKTRETDGRKTRQAGLIPCVVYGKNIENVVIAFDKVNFNRLFREAGTSNLIDLSVDDKTSFKTLVQDVQRNPITLDVVHVDLLKINMKEKISTEIPLEFVGESPAVVDLSGSLITARDSVEIECLPADLPSEIKVDISILDDFEKDIRIKDIVVPAGVEILNDEEEVVVHVEPPRDEADIEADLATPVEENVEEVEVETAKKEDEAEGEQKESKE